VSSIAERDAAARASRWDAFWRSRKHSGDFYAPSPRMVEHVLQYVRPGDRVLEVGPGTGRDAATVAAAGAVVTVIDPSAEALSLIERSGHGRALRLVRGDGQSAPFPDGSFDLVYHQGLLEHFPDPMPLLRENLRLLKPRGILVVDVPQTAHAWTAIKKTLMAFDRWFAGWETQYTPGALRRVVQVAGFEVLESYADWLRPSLIYRSARAVAARARLRLPQYPPWPLRSAWGDAWLRTSVGQLTAMTIGVVARRL
jgi:SAM-dependent methyltransferase